MNNEHLAGLLGLTPPWREVMTAVPREQFVPPRGLASPEGGGAPYPIDRDARPDEWRAAVYSDTGVITQRADGDAAPEDVDAGLASSSISAPGIAYAFLELLDPHDHHRVLEIGTGTGYTAALLSERLGDTNIITVEVDPEVTAQAEANLKAAGYVPRVVLGDGAAGVPDGGPYDRVHATCAVTSIPYAWVEQCRPGAVIVAPWQPLHGHGLRARLTVADGAAVGRFHGPAGYMMLRSHRAALVWRPHHQEQANSSATRLDPRTVHRSGAGVQLAIAARAPGLGTFTTEDPDGSFSLLLYDFRDSSGSWAACDYEPHRTEYVVTQYGPRRLWDELEDAYLWWVGNDSPGPARYGLTVGQDGERLWIDEPSRVITS